MFAGVSATLFREGNRQHRPRSKVSRLTSTIFRVVVSSISSPCPRNASDSTRLDTVLSSDSDSTRGNLLGVIGVDVRLEEVQQSVESINFLNTGYSILATADGIVLAARVWDRGATEEAPTVRNVACVLVRFRRFDRYKASSVAVVAWSCGSGVVWCPVVGLWVGRAPTTTCGGEVARRSVQLISHLG